MARDEKGRFQKGASGNPDKQIDGGLAVEYQARSAAAKREHRTLSETLRRELEKKAAAGEPLTKLEFLVQKALQNHAKGGLTLKDLTYLQKLLGEDTLNINTNGPQVIVVSAAAIQAGEKWCK